MSNAFVYVKKELISGRIEGVQFGPVLYCIARSPHAVLFWETGHTYTVNGIPRYAESQLVGLPDRSARVRYKPNYRQIGHSGGRLTTNRIRESHDEIKLLFYEAPFQGVSILNHVVTAVARKETLIILGGGPVMAPAHTLGRQAYMEWEQRPVRGFINPEIVT